MENLLSLQCAELCCLPIYHLCSRGAFYRAQNAGKEVSATTVRQVWLSTEQLDKEWMTLYTPGQKLGHAEWNISSDKTTCNDRQRHR